MRSSSLSRRDFVRTAAMTSAGILLAPLLPASAQTGIQTITKPVPSTGERLPVIGLGTNQFSVQTPEEMARLEQVLSALVDQGGSVVDTARSYGRAEAVIGELVGRIGRRERFFLVTKTFIEEGASAADEIQKSFDRLGVETIDLLMVHRMPSLEALMSALLQAKQAGRIRYIGISTSNKVNYAPLMDAMRRHPLDFIQVDYSIANRSAADEILPLAQERGIAVMTNLPFGGREAGSNVFGRVAGVALPDWATEIDATSWGQVFLKYLVSHPAVNIAISGTTKVEHLLDNQAAGRGRLPDAAMRQRIEQFWDAL